MRNRIGLLLAVFFLNHPLHSQNLDLIIIHAAGKYRGMAGAGMGIADSITAFDLNPAGLANTRYVSLSTSQSLHYYGYSLFRLNTGSGVLDIRWNDSKYDFENLLIVAPIRKNFGAGIGYVQKLNPFLRNSARAITGSSLINQLTNGSVYALTVASGVRLAGNVSLGVALARYDGTITSQLQGDNHGREIEKSARLISDLNGNQVQIGITLVSKKISAGLVWESPFELKIDAQRQSSADSAYKIFFPNYAQTRWKMPMIIRGGLAYAGFKNWIITLDFERHQYEKADIQLNLYEFGRPPNWKDINIFRVGVECVPWQSLKLPLGLGYARIPQLYASNTASSTLTNTVLESNDTKQNIKHLLTIGTAFSFSNITLNTGLEYKKLEWHRDLQALTKISDDYTEKNYTLFAELVYSLK